MAVTRNGDDRRAAGPTNGREIVEVRGAELDYDALLSALRRRASSLDPGTYGHRLDDVEGYSLREVAAGGLDDPTVVLRSIRARFDTPTELPRIRRRGLRGLNLLRPLLLVTFSVLRRFDLYINRNRYEAFQRVIWWLEQNRTATPTRDPGGADSSSADTTEDMTVSRKPSR